MNAATRAFSSYGPIKEKIAHNINMHEEVRPEFKEMYNELETYVERTMPMIKTYYEECGKPYTTKINHFALPPEIIEAIGPINR